MSSTRAADWLSVTHAIDRILACVEPLEAEHVDILDVAGRVLAQEVDSPIDQPPWDNSAMDGYAVRAEDVRGASAAEPRVLEVIEAVAAGGFPSRRVGPGHAIRIMTGAPIPDGADSVIRIEHAVERDGRVEISDAADALRNIRRRGEDLRAGERVLSRGRVIRAGEAGLLATVGMRAVAVGRRPRVAILSTGDELADLEEFDEVRAGRRIVNSNSYSLNAAVRLAGGEPVLLGIARDERDSLRACFERARGADLIVTTAGASVGEHDLVKDVLEELGFRLDFWRVLMRPGSPFSFGTLNTMPVFGLPGNPVSAVVTFEVLVRPALRRMLGCENVYARTLEAVAGAPVPSAGKLTHFVRGVIESLDPLTVRPTGPQGSGILSSVAAADVLIVVPPREDELPRGTRVRVIPLTTGDAATASHSF